MDNDSAGAATAIELPDHVADSVETIARLHAAHDRDATPGHRVVDWLTTQAGRPRVVLAGGVLAVLWMAGNLALGAAAPDPAPFVGLEATATLTALLMTGLVLATQQRADRLANQRARLTLELALLNEQKTAKIVELLMALRQDHPGIDNRHDAAAEAMARPTDTDAVIGAMRSQQEPANF